MNTSAQSIIYSCEANFKANQADCNGFLIAVVNDVAKIPLAGLADNIVNYLSNPANGWTPLTKGDYNSAGISADNGLLVIGGMTSAALSQPHGHVLVVVSNPYPNVPVSYPAAYWGSLNTVGSFRANPPGFNPPVPSVNFSMVDYSFTKADLPNVLYFTMAIPPGA